MNCKEFSDLLDAFVAGSLPDEQAAALRSHAKACADCARRMQILRDCRQADGETQVPAAFSAAWRRTVREEKAAEKKAQGRRAVRSWLAAAAVLVFVVGGTLLTRNSPPLPKPKASAVRGTEPPALAAAERQPRATFLPVLSMAGEAAYESAAFEDAATPLMAEAFEAEEAEMEKAAAEEAKAEEAAVEAAKAQDAAAMNAAAGGAAEDAPRPPRRERETFPREVLRFLEDMAVFLASALPWLLAAGLVALACRALIQRKKNKDRTHNKEE